MSVSHNIITQGMYTNYTEEQVFFTAKIFTLQEVTLILQDNADEMPAYFNMSPNYTISQWRNVSVMLTDFGDNTLLWYSVGNSMPRALLPMGLIIRHQVTRWMTKWTHWVQLTQCLEWDIGKKKYLCWMHLNVI